MTSLVRYPLPRATPGPSPRSRVVTPPAAASQNGNVAGVTALIAVAGIAGTPAGSANVTGVTAQVAIAAPAGTATGGAAGISYNTGTTATATAVAHTVQPTLVIPAGVLSGDVMIVTVSMFTYTPTGAGITLTATSGHAWTNIGGGIQASPAVGGLQEFGKVFKRVAAAGDAGDTLTFAFTGTQGATDSFWWALSIAAWSGASDVDVVATPSTGTGANSLPSVLTGVAGDWRIGAGAIAVATSGTISAAPAGAATIRENANTAGIACAISDGNASAGAAGTSIGGGSFTTSSGGTGDQWATFTIGLAPAGAGGSASVTGITAPVAVAAPAGTPSGSANVTGVSAHTTVAGGLGTPAGSAAVTGTSAAIAVAAPAGTPSGIADVTGTTALVNAAAPAGTAAGTGGGGANVTGVTAAVSVTAPAGVVSGSANVTGTRASVLVAAGLGTLAASANVAGTAALIAVAGGAGTPAAGGPFTVGVLTAADTPAAVLTAAAASATLTASDSGFAGG